MRRTLACLLRDRTGASVLETALILPLFLLLFAGTTDLAMAFSLKLRTQQAAARASEMVTAAGLEALTVDQLRSDAANAAGVAASKVTVTRTLECAGTLTAFDSACSAGQETARYIGIRVANSYAPVLGPLLPPKIAPGGKLTFVGASTVRVQ